MSQINSEFGGVSAGTKRGGWRNVARALLVLTAAGGAALASPPDGEAARVRRKQNPPEAARPAAAQQPYSEADVKFQPHAAYPSLCETRCLLAG